MLELVLVRHGETDSNIERRFLGWTDMELNDRGLYQARCTGEKLKDEKFDGAYCSPLRRCMKTAQIINENHKLKISVAEDLKERNFGSWENLTHAEIKEKYPEEFAGLARDWKNHRAEGGESAFQTHQRVAGFADSLLTAHKEGKLLIVSHVGPLKAIITHLLQMEMEALWRFRIDNCGITRIEINNDGFAYLTMLNG